MKKALSQFKFEELKGKSFDLIHVIEMLCEVCEKPLNKKERFLKKTKILGEKDYQNLLDRVAVHDRVEVDVEENKIYFYDHDFPGDIHPECVEKL